jgi:hypothetical protein
MSRNESRKLVLMGLALLFMVLFLVRGSLDRDSRGPQEEPGVVVKPGPRPGGSVAVDPLVGELRPSQDPAVAVKTLQALEDEREAGNAPAPLPFEPSQERLHQVRDLALDLVEEPGFYELLARVQRMSDEELAKAPEAVGTFTHRDFLPPPGFDKARARETGSYPHLDAVRGHFVHMRGRFATFLFQRVLADYPNEAGLAWVWQGMFVGTGGHPYFVTILDKTFEPVYGQNGEPIQLTGAFLKLYSYQPVGDDETPKTVPHLIVKRIERAKPLPKWDYMVDTKLWVGGAVFLLFLGLTALYARASRKSTDELERWRRERFSKRVDMSKAVADAKAKAGTPAAGEAIGTPVESTPQGEVAKPASTAEPVPEAEAAAETAPEAETAAEAEAEPAEAEAEPAAEAEAEPAEAEAEPAEAEAEPAEAEAEPAEAEPPTDGDGQEAPPSP